MIRSSEPSRVTASLTTQTTSEASTTKQHQANNSGGNKDYDDNSDNDGSNNRDDNVVNATSSASTGGATTEEKHGQQQVFSNSNNSNKLPKRNPFCSRCRNHGKSIQVKGHKRHCEYRECKCEGCFDVECRQIISARQIKRRRDQKQDEECGRRIEISPPILRRNKCIDPIALTPETLRSRSSSEIGHPILKQNNLHQQLHVSTATPTSQAPPTALHYSHPSINPTTLAVAPSSALGIQHSNHHIQLHHPIPSQHHNHNKQHQVISTCVNDANHQQLQTNNLHSSRSNLTNLASVVNNVHHHNTTTSSSGNNVVAAAAEASSAALTNALHLFQYPRSMLLSTAAANPTSQPPPVGRLATSLANSPDNPRHYQHHISQQPPSPSIREQINLVEEIHHTFGPLAIYAWLKAERFDLQKVRDLIESSLSSYNDLIDLKFTHRPRNSSDISRGAGDGFSINARDNVNNHHRYHTATDLAIGATNTDDVNNVNCNHPRSIRNGCTTTAPTIYNSSGDDNGSNNNNSSNNKSPSIDIPTTTTTPISSSTSLSTFTTTIAPTPISIAKTISNYQNISSTTPTITNLPTSPMCRNSSSFNNSNNYIDSDNNNVSKTATPVHHHTMSLATLNSLPMSTANGLLWPDLKLAANSGVPSTSMIYPHHLLPHFMHHPLTMIHHQFHNNSHHQNQVSPLSSIANLSSSSESSSSTIL